MRKFPLCAPLVLMMMLGASALCAEEPAALAGLSRFTLPNGLEVYAYRDAAVPLVRIQLAFRTGAISQSAESAGLFRLYERLLLEGSGSSTDLKSSLASLGLERLNGGTGVERVDYWISLPSSRLAEGLDLMEKSLCSPRLEGDSLDAQKAEVIKEINSQAAEPDLVYEAAMTRRLFAKFPWRRDVMGSEKAVRAATIASLRALGSTWFVPCNAALFIGGDIEPEEARAAVEAAFGAWAAAPSPWPKNRPPNPRPGVVRPTWVVYPDPSLPEGMGRIEARYRGPDLASDAPSSYAADLWSALVAPKDGKFKAAILANVPKLSGSEGLAAGYFSQRDGGWISLSSYFLVDPALPAVDRARAFKERERAYEITSMKGDTSYFTNEDYEAARRRILDYRALTTETAEGMIETLAFWWAAASVDYYAGYPAALARTGAKEVSAFLDTYVMRNLEVIALRMNPADIEREKRPFGASGFETVSPANAFWWQK